jgi:hypothetical protein
MQDRDFLTKEEGDQKVKIQLKNLRKSVKICVICVPSYYKSYFLGTHAGSWLAGQLSSYNSTS